MKKKLSHASTKALSQAKNQPTRVVKAGEKAIELAAESMQQAAAASVSPSNAGADVAAAVVESATEGVKPAQPEESFSIEDIANGQSLVPGMGRRMLAYMADFAIATVLGTGLLMAVLWATTGTQVAAGLANLFSIFVFCNAVNAAHHIFFESHPRWRATLGKVIMGLTVIDADGDPITRSVAIKRFLWRIPSVMSVGFLYLMSGMGNYGLALHDRKTATVTVVRDMPAARVQSGLRAGREFTGADKACLVGAAVLLCNVAYNLFRRVF